MRIERGRKTRVYIGDYLLCQDNLKLGVRYLTNPFRHLFDTEKQFEEYLRIEQEVLQLHSELEEEIITELREKLNSEINLSPGDNCD